MNRERVPYRLESEDLQKQHLTTTFKQNSYPLQIICASMKRAATPPKEGELNEEATLMVNNPKRRRNS